MSRPPPTSTLFPYTTLFRSGLQRRLLPDLDRQVLLERLARGQRGALEEKDRKSTRLNSSHVKISYAVFCLKKKREWRGTRPAVHRSRRFIPRSARAADRAGT